MADQAPQDVQHIINDLVKRLNRLESSNRGAMQQGLAANRPAAPTTTNIYYATNTKVLSIWNSATSAWNTVSLA